MYYLCGYRRMEVQELGKCPVCRASCYQPHAVCTDHAVSGENFILAHCPQCGLVFTLQPPSEIEMAGYDKVGLKLKLGNNPSGLVHRLYWHARSVMLRRKAALIEMFSGRNSGNLLNYGAKTGFFSSFMEDRGWNVTSVEKYHEERFFALENFHHRMITVADMQMLKPQTFDIITMWHVFEHNRNPETLLKRFHTLLRPDGLMIVACPNYTSADASYYGPYWAGYDVPRHLWHFTPLTITGLAEKYGFSLMHHEPLPFDSFYISVLSEQNAGHRFPFIRGMYHGLVSWLKSKTNRGRSSSLVYVFRKK